VFRTFGVGTVFDDVRRETEGCPRQRQGRCLYDMRSLLAGLPGKAEGLGRLGRLGSVGGERADDCFGSKTGAEVLQQVLYGSQTMGKRPLSKLYER
jgi:hypothetical protein